MVLLQYEKRWSFQCHLKPFYIPDYSVKNLQLLYTLRKKTIDHMIMHKI